MRLTTKGRFAVTAMIDLALREHTGPVALAAISSRQQISLSYLEQLFARLRRKGLVKSARGPGGGYRLAQEADKTWIADIVLASFDGVPIRVRDVADVKIGHQIRRGEKDHQTQKVWRI